jgi:hypothetical protein
MRDRWLCPQWAFARHSRRVPLASESRPHTIPKVLIAVRSEPTVSSQSGAAVGRGISPAVLDGGCQLPSRGRRPGPSFPYHPRSVYHDRDMPSIQISLRGRVIALGCPELSALVLPCTVRYRTVPGQGQGPCPALVVSDKDTVRSRTGPLSCPTRTGPPSRGRLTRPIIAVGARSCNRRPRGRGLGALNAIALPYVGNHQGLTD